WCDGDWLLAPEANQSVLLGEYSYSVYSGCPDGAVDFKWKVLEGEEGEYEIQVDLENERISIASKVAVNQIENNNEMSVYPNPAKDQVKIQMSEEADRFEMFDQTGRSVWVKNERAQSIQLKVSDFKAGVYVLMANTASGKLRTKRLVISK
ncbi:MAG: T9SS type A sorting domain-containing protein, partial [Prolixibacteraceae bacterium]|nr:T9SS type A sorting domain-containing protein [Prolixibacteraceae bacterium]